MDAITKLLEALGSSEPSACTGWAAQWCPVCGDCICNRGSWPPEKAHPGCPLHGPESHHAESGEQSCLTICIQREGLLRALHAARDLRFRFRYVYLTPWVLPDEHAGYMTFYAIREAIPHLGGVEPDGSTPQYIEMQAPDTREWYELWSLSDEARERYGYV